MCVCVCADIDRYLQMNFHVFIFLNQLIDNSFHFIQNKEDWTKAEYKVFGEIYTHTIYILSLLFLMKFDKFGWLSDFSI